MPAPGGSMKRFLRSGHRAVHLPLVHPEVDSADRADAVHVQHRRVRRRIERPANARDVAHHAGGGLVVDYHDRLDLVRRVGGQRLRDSIERRALAPLGLEHLHVETEPPRHLDPEVTELAEARGQHPVAGRKRVGERRLPPAGARGGKDEALARFGLEDALQIVQEWLGQRWKTGRPVVFHRDVHRAQHAVRDVGRSRDEQEIAAWH